MFVIPLIVSLVITAFGIAHEVDKYETKHHTEAAPPPPPPEEVP